MKSILFALTLLMTVVAGAHGEAAHEEHGGLPTQMLVLQTANFLLFLGALIYFLRPKVKTFFRMREENFVAAKKRADEMKRTAAENKKLMAEKLKTLESSRQATLASARQEAEQLRKQISRDADEMVVKIKEEAERSVQNEIGRARQELRAALLTEAIDAAKKQVAKNLSDIDQRRLQDEFVEKIQAVKQ